MRYFIILSFIFLSNSAVGQSNNILLYKKHFDKELKLWANTFNSFKLTDFKIADTLHFDNNHEQDFNNYKAFLFIYKPIVTYSSDSSQFIDIYSYQINLEKKGNYYYANPDIDQAIYLCNPKRKYWNRIFFGTSSQWIDEAIWLSKTKFILMGITKSSDDKKMPLILLSDTNSQTIEKYLTQNNSCYQNIKGYQSPKLKKLKIKGL